MARRVARTARRHGLADGDASRIERAYRLAMRPRVGVLDDHDPDYLHPGRTPLILLDDAGLTDADALAAAALCETLRPAFAVSAAEAGAQLGPRVRALLEAVPSAAEAGEELLERLLAIEPAAQLIAVAEWLDHARHLHLQPAEGRAPLVRTTCEAYAPLAARVSPALARRYRVWCGRVAGRLLDAGG